jgi:hypothetical protein
MRRRAQRTIASHGAGSKVILYIDTLHCAPIVKIFSGPDFNHHNLARLHVEEQSTSISHTIFIPSSTLSFL